MIVLKLKDRPAGMLAEYIAGEASGINTDSFEISNPVRIFEYLLPDGKIVLNYVGDSIFSLSKVLVSKSDVMYHRHIDADDKDFLKNYEEAHSAARMAKAGLVPSKNETVSEVKNG